MFKLPMDAEKWFSNIRPALDLEFDIYYYCLILGLHKGEKETYTHSETKDLVREFPKPYSSESKIISALFLKKEIENLGISLDDRTLVHDTLKKYIDSETSAKLSDEAIKEMNKYANAGIKILKEEFFEKPRKIEVFLVNYYELFQ